eukprot:TRINITY_DN4477_c0_g1_i4.p1 TRINITY_DN4477_c0_g1~~TRINITY_DN4477_c0_g1_i4.p1  ORF type:complete len:945 (+),score=174.40 TRINITY_DN4477_c0_g1_i4:95-2929(+)
MQQVDPGRAEEHQENYDDDSDDKDYGASTGIGGVVHETKLITGDMVVARHDYEAQSEDELTFREGDIMTITGKDDGDVGWYLADMYGRQGLIPWNFVEKVDAKTAPALDAAARQADLHSELWGSESERKHVQLTILSARGLDARHDGCSYVQVDVVGQADSSFRTSALQAGSIAWQHRSLLSLEPGASLRLSVYQEVPSQPDRLLGSAQLLLLGPEMAWHGELGLVLGGMQGGLLSISLVSGLPVDEGQFSRPPIRQSLIDRQSITPETSQSAPRSNLERNTPPGRSPMPESAQTLSPSLSEVKHRARKIIVEATRNGRLKEALRQIPKSATSVQKEQASMVMAKDVKRQAQAMLLQAAQDGHLRNALAQIPKGSCSEASLASAEAAENGHLEMVLAQGAAVARAGDIKRQAQAMLLQAAQDGHLRNALSQIPKGSCSEASLARVEAAENGHLEMVLAQGAAVARAGDIKRQAQAMLLQAAQDGHLRNALAQIPKASCSETSMARAEASCAEASLTRAEESKRLAQALVTNIFFLATAESSEEATSEPVPPVKSAGVLIPCQVVTESSEQAPAELAPKEHPSEGHLHTFLSSPHRPLGPPPTGRRPPPTRKFSDPDAEHDAELEEDRRLLRSKHLNNLRQQRLRNYHAQAPVQGSEEASIVCSNHQHSLRASSELGPDWYKDRMLEHFQRRRHLRGPGAAAVFEPSQPDPHTVPRTTSRPAKQPSPAAASSPVLVQPSAKQRGNGMHSQARPQPPACKRAGVPPQRRSVEAPLTENEPGAFPDFSQDVDTNGVAALYGVYTALVCSRRLEDQRWPIPQNNTGPAMNSTTSWRSGMSTVASKHCSVSPGLAAFASRTNPWHWPRDGGIPPMDRAVVALLEGQPPPTKVSPEQTLAARQALRLPVVRKTLETPRWPEPVATSSPRKPSDRPYWFRGAGRRLSPGMK